MRYYDYKGNKYLSVSEIIDIDNYGKDWGFIKEEYENKRCIGSWCAEEQTELGVIFHKFVDKSIKGLIQLPNWLEFMSQYENKFSEVNLYHKDKFYAGTADIILQNKNKLRIIDVKTVVFTDINDSNGAKFTKKINDKKNKTILQLSAYGESLLSHRPELDIEYQILVYNPFDTGLILDHIYTDSQVKSAKKKFERKYDKCLELGFIETG